MEVQSRVGSPNRTKPNRTEPYRTLGEPNRDHVRFLANTNRDEQSLPMFGSFGCSVRQNTNRTEQMCLMFVFGSCSVRLVRYNVLATHFQNCVVSHRTTLCVYFWFSVCAVEIDYLYHQNSCNFRCLG